MAESLLSFDQEFQPQIENELNTVVNHIQTKMADAKSLSVDEAEKLLDDACNDCIKTLQSKMEDIRDSVKTKRPDPSSSTYDEDNKKYTNYIAVVASGITKSKSLFDTVFYQIRSIVSTVIECIKAGANYIWDQLNEAFNSVRSLFTSQIFS
jgi:ElaB/YqjD/DUF883 family membrane-anchored ribosome-binding protein